MIELKITTNTLGARNKLRTLESSLKDFKEPLSLVRNYMQRRIRMNFQNNGSTFREPWRPLEKSTMEFKEWMARKGLISAGNVDRILRATGEMEQSFVFRVRKNALIISNTSPHFIKHQAEDGRSRVITNWHGKRVTLPRRVMMKFEEQERRHALAIFNGWLGRNVKRAESAGSGTGGTGGSGKSGWMSAEEGLGYGTARD